jgi:hypothetical protein
MQRIERQVRRAFTAAPQWTTAELASWCWPARKNRVPGSYRNWWRVRREASKWAVPISRRWPGGIVWKKRAMLTRRLPGANAKQKHIEMKGNNAA